MHVQDLVGISGFTRVLLVCSCQQGAHPPGRPTPLAPEEMLLGFQYQLQGTRHLRRSLMETVTQINVMRGRVVVVVIVVLCCAMLFVLARCCGNSRCPLHQHSRNMEVLDMTSLVAIILFFFTLLTTNLIMYDTYSQNTTIQDVKLFLRHSVFSVSSTECYGGWL